MNRSPRMVLAAILILLTWLVALPELAGSTPVGGSGQIRYGVSKFKGFDTCSAPSASRMQTWWRYSPYFDVGIYIGGSNRACSQPNLTTSWVTTVHNQGWSFYLTWVGPQAPCTYINTSSRFSSTASTAAQQGRNQADAAVNAARNLGFTGKNVYYYDMEHYNTGNSTCRNAVKSFVSGWVGRLRHYWGEASGMYGATCGSAVNDWASIPNIPDDVWLAYWNNDPDVWGLKCVPDGNWVFNQRIHQYRGGHNETWGGITLGIDNDCASGPVTPHGHGPYEDRACTVE
jgi:hypothetical protein